MKRGAQTSCELAAGRGAGAAGLVELGAVVGRKTSSGAGEGCRRGASWWWPAELRGASLGVMRSVARR